MSVSVLECPVALIVDGIYSHAMFLSTGAKFAQLEVSL